jgi:hypothetical protein
MKNFLSILSLIIFFSACNKNDDGEISPLPGYSNSGWTFTSTVNGIVLNADSARGYLHIDTSLGIPIRAILISGLSGHKNIVPGFGDLINTTTPPIVNYDSIGTGAQLQYYDFDDSINEYHPISSSISITAVDSLNRKFSGTFSGVVVGNVTGDTIVVTNGSFMNIEYVVY